MKLQRFLDATRAELFFARRVLMVEGIAEALLLPVLAKSAGGSLKKSAVTVVNADGINFNAFLLFLVRGNWASRSLFSLTGTLQRSAVNSQRQQKD